MGQILKADRAVIKINGQVVGTFRRLTEEERKKFDQAYDEAYPGVFTLNSYDNKCTCTISTIMKSGCKCGGK